MKIEIRQEIFEMFDDYQISEKQERQSIEFVRRAFGKNYEEKINTNDSFEIVDNRTKSIFEDEYLYLVSLLYNKENNLEKCWHCGNNKIYRVKNRRSFSCTRCGRQVYPTRGTIFEKSTTPLKIWFVVLDCIAEYKFSIKDIERKFGICYKTSHRIYHLIKEAVFFKTLINYQGTIQYQTIEQELKDNKIPTQYKAKQAPGRQIKKTTLLK